MGIPGSANPMLFGGAAAYQINQSLRFRGNSTYFTKTFGSSGNRRKFTLSVWVKKATVTAVNPNDTGLNFFSSNSGSVSDSMNVGMSASTEAIQFYQYNSGYTGGIYSFARYRDPSAWMHMVFVWDSDQTSSAADRMAVYVNNRIERPNGSESANTGPALNKDAAWNYSSYTHAIGGTYQTNHMYLAEAYHIDGQALDPSSFGETDPITGAWIPKKYSGSYTGNSFYLKFDPSATNGIGHDHSGLGNHWTPTGFSTSGTGTDVMSDTPTNNYATLNPLSTTAGSYSEGNLIYYSASGFRRTHGTIGVSSGKWYYEFTLTSSPYSPRSAGSRWAGFGFGLFRFNESTNYDSEAITLFDNGYRANWSTGTPTYTDVNSASFSNGDVLSIAVDIDAGTYEFRKNNTSVDSGSIGAASGAILFPHIVHDTNAYSNYVVNFGQRSFSYTPPTGYKALNTANLPEPTIKKGDKYFDTKLYTGTGGSQSLSGLGFQPDLVWIKARSTASSHGLYDAVRGVGQVLLSNSTSAEQNYGSYGVTSFNSAGFSVNDLPGYGVNDSGQTYAAWCWDANGAGSSNTAGSITSTVSANASAGFSIVTYTSPSNTADQTVGHGLGVKPSLIIVKNRDLTYNWDIYHASLGYNASLIFTSAGTRSGAFGAEPTSTVFTTKTNYTHNSTNTYVAYCFSEVAGYSKFGSYTGNGSSDGPFVFCNFRPAWIMIKDSTGSGNSWYISDNKRNTYNVVNGRLMADLSNDESTSVSICDFTSNGFKIRTSDSGWNTSSSTYIFAAFSETAFKFANAR